jgi:type II secretory pathway pseudopilin PulG
MDIHPPAAIHSLRDFFVHLLIVILGILIALGLEQVIEAHHRAKLASNAVASFRSELTANRARVTAVMAAMPRIRKQIADEIAAVKGAPTNASAPIHLAYPPIEFDLVSSANWETAIATQALHEIPEEEATRFSDAYGVFKVFLDVERGGLTTWQELVKFGDDLAALDGEQRRHLIEQLNSYAGYTYVVDLVGKGTLETCDQALKQ